MGNFYSNFTVLGVGPEETLEAARELGRTAFVMPSSHGDSLLFDEACGAQDVHEIQLLGSRLSSQLDAPVVACLNHDDDYLLLWVFEGGRRVDYHRSFLDAPHFARSLSRLRGGNLAYPLVLAVLAWPFFFFEILRHQLLVGVLALPVAAVGLSYQCIAQGELPLPEKN